jgi:hypothetical protein
MADVDRSGVEEEGEVEGHPSKTPPGEYENEEGVYAI